MRCLSYRMYKVSLPLFASALISSISAYAGDDLDSSTIDLQGVALQSGTIAKKASDNDAIGASPIYQYAISGTVTGSGSFSFISAGTDVATALDLVQPGFSENLTGVIVNAKGKLPFIVVNRKLQGSFNVGPVPASARATVQAGITKPGQTFFSFTGVSFLVGGFPLPGNSKITFDAGSTCRVFVPEGRAQASQPDLIVASGNEDAVGNNIYNTTGSNQSVSRALKKKESFSFNVLVQNDGTSTDSIAVTGPKGDEDVSISYFIGKKNVTAQVTGTDTGGQAFADLPSLGGKVLKVKVKAKKADASFSGTIVAAGSTNDQDAVAINIGAM
jgi:hypothetical protein